MKKRIPFVNHDVRIGRLFGMVDSLLEEQGGSAPIEPEDMDGESDPVDPIGADGERIAEACTAYGEAIDIAKGAQAYIDGIGPDTDKGEAKVMLKKAQAKAKEGLKALTKAVSKLEGL